MGKLAFFSFTTEIRSFQPGFAIKAKKIEDQKKNR